MFPRVFSAAEPSSHTQPLSPHIHPAFAAGKFHVFSPFPKRAGVVAHELKQEVELGSRMMEELASVSFFANTIARLESLRGCTGR